jgi:RNA polymerase sigma-70 factor (ECF subfamily)
MPVAPAQVYEEEFSFVWRNLKRLGVDQALLEDATHDVFLVVVRRLPEFQGRSSMRTWIFGIAYNVAQQYRRKSGAFPPTEMAVDELPAAEDSPDRGREGMDRLRLVHGALAHLDQEKRAVFVLAELEEMTAPQIAEALNLKLNTVYSRLRFARQEFEAAVARLKLVQERSGR